MNTEKQFSREQIIVGLKKMITDMDFIKKSEDFDGKKGGIWTSSEHAWIYKGLPPFDHNTEYGDLSRKYIGGVDAKHGEMKVETRYVNGIHREIYSWLEEHGWYPEWYDTGTLFFWKNDIEREECKR